MKVLAVIVVLGLVGGPRVSNAQPMKMMQVGNIVLLQDTGPVCWGIGGIPFIYVRASSGKLSPITRSEVYDARSVEILNECSTNPLKPRDVKVLKWKGHVFVTVRGLVLAEVLPQDASAAGTTRLQLAKEWANSVRNGLMQVEPL